MNNNSELEKAVNEYTAKHGETTMTAKTFKDAVEWGSQHADDETSDGYHTIGELYQYRMLYNASFFNMLSLLGICTVVKSKRHSDGEECFGGGWFIVVAELPTGQISNHYELKDWDLFHITEVEKSPKWDGHTPSDVADRLEKFCKLNFKIKN